MVINKWCRNNLSGTAHSASRDPKKAVVGRHRHVSYPGRKFRASVETATENVKVVDKFFGAVADCLSTLTRVLSEA